MQPDLRTDTPAARLARHAAQLAEKVAQQTSVEDCRTVVAAHTVEAEMVASDPSWMPDPWGPERDR